MSSSIEKLAPGLLIASPTLRDPHFDHAVVLLCASNEQGAMGLVINKPSSVTSREVIAQMGYEQSSSSQFAMIGGPVAGNSGLLLYIVDPGAECSPDELQVTDTLRLCPNADVLKAIARGKGPSQYHIFLGHAGWGPGQLEKEVSLGAWIPGNLQRELVFDVPVEQRWETALRDLGITPGQATGFKPCN